MIESFIRKKKRGISMFRKIIETAIEIQNDADFRDTAETVASYMVSRCASRKIPINNGIPSAIIGIHSVNCKLKTAFAHERPQRQNSIARRVS